jgi:hypothetical protein
LLVFSVCRIAGCYPFDFGYHGGVGPENKGSNAALMRKLQRADYELPGDVSPDLADLIGLLIQPDVAKRLDAKQALKHRWTLAGDRTEAEIDQMAQSMSHEFISTPQGDNPEAWLEKLAGTESAAPAKAPAKADVDFDDDEDQF